MRFSMKTYEDGKVFEVETNNSGTAILKNLSRTKKGFGKRISAYIEVMSDETLEGMDRILTSLAKIQKQIEQRKKQLFD